MLVKESKIRVLTNLDRTDPVIYTAVFRGGGGYSAKCKTAVHTASYGKLRTKEQIVSGNLGVVGYNRDADAFFGKSFVCRKAKCVKLPACCGR